MLRVLQFIFQAIWFIGFAGNGLLFVYTEWNLIYYNWFEILNPMFQLKVLIAILTTPLFWILLAVTVVGFFAGIGVAKMREELDR